jgi:signal transduction histidine kinase
VETQLFGIAREALVNVVKHAGAGSAWVHVEARPATVLVEIGDDGCGFDQTGAHPGHFGLESMRGRAAQIGAVFRIASTPGHGTLVSVEVPIGTNPPLNGG